MVARNTTHKAVNAIARPITSDRGSNPIAVLVGGLLVAFTLLLAVVVAIAWFQ